MKKVIVIVLGLVVLTSAPAVAMAADLTDKQKSQIAESCQAAQSTLQRISNSDTTTRINRGRDYDQVLKLFYTMNTRAASNNLTEPKLAEITKNFENALNGFRADYNRYNDHLKSAYEINCKNQVANFYDNLSKTRDGRAVINADIVVLDNLINEYQLVVGGLAP
ncbi:MAG: hypothetical protein LBU20_02685 [Candidatus Nomurabacteria bacterium]|jgi:hypothetical protein|nr:hypothetical protein [Candidatus Nomurabacteria bacterium]